MNTAIEILCIVLLLALVGGSLLNLLASPHWFVRGWDFPRVQILLLTFLLVLIYAASQKFGRGLESVLWNWFVGGLSLFLLLWHLLRILPYTPLANKQTLAAESRDEACNLRLVVSNIEMDNDQYETWMSVIRQAQADVVIVLETDQRWLDHIKPLRQEYAEEIAVPQDNCYGMLMLSQLPISESRVRYLVEDDIPSIDAVIELPCDVSVRVVGVHPRPPEPIRDTDATERDAELILYSRELSDETRPVVIGGDLNDVAWSWTTRLFLKISGMMDPRRGRGLFNTFHAGHWWMRFPLDHLFHSDDFTLRQIARLDYVGSDHFPMLLDLQYEPGKGEEQEALEDTPEDHRQAEEIIDRERESDD